MATVTHLLFDFFGTLVTYSDSWVTQGFHRSHRLVLDWGADLDYRAFLTAWDTTFAGFEGAARADLQEYSMADVCKRFLRDALRSEPPSFVIDTFRQTYLQEWDAEVRPIAGVPAMLEEFASRFALVLVTNTHDADFVRSHLATMRIAPHFAAVVTSVEHGKRKPSPCIFERALALSGGTPESAVHVGDSYVADYQGAAAAGVRCLLIDPDESHAIPAQDRLTHVLDTRDRLRARRRQQS